MQVKRFFAPDMRQAMKFVRDELGADAVIMGNRKVAGGIELTACLDYPTTPSAAAAPAQPSPALTSELQKTQSRIAQARAELLLRSAEEKAANRQMTDKRIEPVLPSEPVNFAQALKQRLAEPVAAPAADSQSMAQVKAELSGLRELLEVQLGSMAWNRVSQQSPLQARLCKRLLQMGLPAEMARTLLSRVAREKDPRKAWRMVLAHLAHAVKTPLKEPLQEPGLIALVGPAGMGKTTTLAKLAARYVLQYGAHSLALVSLDSYRIGAQEQLRTLGRILGVPVTAADPSQPLQHVLRQYADKRTVLIDTAGMPKSAPGLREQLTALESLRGKVRNYLVLGATSQAAVMQTAWQNYQSCGLNGLILSRVDEAATLGEALSLAITRKLPVAYVADGPRIPEDISVPTAAQLVSRAVHLQLPDEPAEETLQGMFAGLDKGEGWPQAV
ncbi:flagellar biosynthesis protein FlhF [Atopomonas sediminilitoris]|uniref:flagellar biosynthesis protein FlhF n=1 Tax=Atopomonas sediminilitoris TaxID=2919919 RepID=UPI001F4DAB00|nr:flagellar biosynthesis protein FlhF [Atopomonas sediminilitoris]MCJ8167934.1 flagellar biosynthesis protein FlhF [Atopomonas sediminilitoris]